MTNIPKEIEHYINQFKNYTDDELRTITLRYAPKLEYNIAARLLLENREKKEQEKTNNEILKAAIGANRWAMYATIIALLSFLFLVAVWINEHSQPLIDNKQQIEKIETLPTKPQLTKETSGSSNGLPHISPIQSEMKNRQAEKLIEPNASKDSSPQHKE